MKFKEIRWVSGELYKVSVYFILGFKIYKHCIYIENIVNKTWYSLKYEEIKERSKENSSQIYS